MNISKYFNIVKYLSFLTQKMIILVSPIIYLWEKKQIEKFSAMKLEHQPVFIIGAPRTGSTILYQTLTNQLDVIYFDNLISWFYKNIFFASWLSSKVFKGEPHDCFRSTNGDTSKGGLRAPSECGSFWYRWLPMDKHFIDYDEITDKMVEDIRKEVSAIINYHNKPILFKNLNAGQRLRLISKCFPNAKFIYVNREPVYTAQSILLAKRKVGIKDNDFWSIMPKNVNQLRNMNTYEQIIKQIYYLQLQILEDKRLFQDACFLEVEYCNLKDKFNSIVNRCQKHIGACERANFKEPHISIDEKYRLNKVEITRFSEEIEKLDWKRCING